MGYDLFFYQRKYYSKKVIIILHQFRERSSLYNIQPTGIRSKYVESLTSYIIRISYEHNITVGHLINKLIAHHINKEYLMRSGTYGGNRFYEGAKTINGYMENSEDLVKSIEKLTSRNDLSNLTLIKLRDFIPLRNLLKETLSWCPECIHNWHSNSTVYYPLIWHIKTVQICIEHRCYLIEVCPVCNKKVDILRRQMIPGYCSNCLSLLTINSKNENPDSIELSWQAFVIENIEDILTLDNDYGSTQSLRGRLLSQLNLIYDEHFSGNLSNFSKFLNIPKTTLRCWLSHDNFPTLESLLLICFKLKIKIMDLLFEREKTSGRIFQIDNLEIVKKEKQSRKPFNLISIEKKLEELLKIDPAISMSAAAIHIGHDKRVLYKNFPDLCKQLSKRYKEFVVNRSNQRIETLKEEINNAFISLTNQGIYPSRRKMELTVNKKGLLKEKVLQDYWKNLLNGSGLEE